MSQNKNSVMKNSAKKAAKNNRRGVDLSSQRVRDLVDADLEDEVSPSGSAGAYGRCGGRDLTSRIEQRLCILLQTAGIAHSHAPRHFEVRLGEKAVAAYAPDIVLRGRGREGKTVILESVATAKEDGIQKICAFRKQYGAEFYVIMVAKEEVLDKIPLEAYDEGSTLTELSTLIGRLSD
jgi:hypothetical protein